MRISPSFALLDRFLCSTSWKHQFSLCISISLLRYQFDHNVLLIDSNHTNINRTQKIIRFEKTWIGNEEFEKLIIKWWLEYSLAADLGNNWKDKLQFIRRQIRGWSNNLKGEIKRTKEACLEQLEELELIQELRELDSIELGRQVECFITLDKIYLDEETYWLQKAKI
jgi:hypothetical protein